jgi:hypothetical protein
LDKSAKKAIWTTFIERPCKAGGGTDIADVVSPEQLENLARKDLNGREVRYFV